MPWRRCLIHKKGKAARKKVFAILETSGSFLAALSQSPWKEEDLFRIFQCQQHKNVFGSMITRYKGPLHLPILAALILCLANPLTAAAPEDDSNLTSRAPSDRDDVIQSMLQRGRETTGRFSGYQALRTFEAENPRFQLRAKMVVTTKVGPDRRAASQTVSFEGSELIRKYVFTRILEAEEEASQRPKDVDITPENYRFHFEKMEVWEGRENYVFAITPFRKSKYAIHGRIWLDRNDLEIARIVGSPAKRPSFWTTNVKIEKNYCKQGSRWLPAKLSSESQIFLAGKSKLEIGYNYPKTTLN